MDGSFLAKDWTLRTVNQAMACGYNNWEEKIYFDYLDRFRLNPKSKVSELSRGMHIKLMLAIAFSHHADLLILDEPTSGMDPSTRDRLTDILKTYVEDDNNTVLFSTHITQDLDRIADYIVFIDNGQVVTESSKEAFKERYIVVKGGLEDFNLISDSRIVGLKNNSYSFEALIEKESLNLPTDQLVIEQPDIEHIMILYGRKLDERYT